MGRNRIPSMFHIYVPSKPEIMIKYNHIEVERDFKSNQKPSKHDTHKTK